jgi:hypothetical protein
MSRIKIEELHVAQIWAHQPRLRIPLGCKQLSYKHQWIEKVTGAQKILDTYFLSCKHLEFLTMQSQQLPYQAYDWLPWEKSVNVTSVPQSCTYSGIARDLMGLKHPPLLLVHRTASSSTPLSFLNYIKIA